MARAARSECGLGAGACDCQAREGWVANGRPVSRLWQAWVGAVCGSEGLEGSVLSVSVVSRASELGEGEGEEGKGEEIEALCGYWEGGFVSVGVWAEFTH